MKPKLVSLGFATPNNHVHTQAEVLQLLGYKSRLAKAVFMNAQIEKRHFYTNPIAQTWQELTEAYDRGSIELSVESAKRCLDGRDPKTIDQIIYNSVSGYNVLPPRSYAIARVLGLRNNVKHTNNLSQGCQASVPGLELACNHFIATDKPALVISTEICSASFCPHPETDLENVISYALFADASASALVGYDTDPTHPYLMDFESLYAPQYEQLLGYRWHDGRMCVVLSRKVPELVPPLVVQAIDNLLERNGLQRQDVNHWVLHPGGAAILEKLEELLGITREQTWASWEAMRLYGNVSSATIGIVGKIIKEQSRPRGWMVIATMGAGNACNAGLLCFEEQ